MTIYETIKAAISVKQAAEHCRLKELQRHGLLPVPQRQASELEAEWEDYFFCFGCGAKGDADRPCKGRCSI